MSDGISDGYAIDRLASDVENSAWDLADAIYRARIGHRGFTPGDVELANEKLQLFGLRLVKESGFAERMERSGPYFRRTARVLVERGMRTMKECVLRFLKDPQLPTPLTDAQRDDLVRRIEKLDVT